MTNADQLTQAIEAFIAAKIMQLASHHVIDSVSAIPVVNQTRADLADELHRILQK